MKTKVIVSRTETGGIMSEEFDQPIVSLKSQILGQLRKEWSVTKWFFGKNWESGKFLYFRRQKSWRRSESVGETTMVFRWVTTLKTAGSFCRSYSKNGLIHRRNSGGYPVSWKFIHFVSKQSEPNETVFFMSRTVSTRRKLTWLVQRHPTGKIFEKCVQKIAWNMKQSLVRRLPQCVAATKHPTIYLQKKAVQSNEQSNFRRKRSKTSKLEQELPFISFHWNFSFSQDWYIWKCPTVWPQKNGR